MKIYNKEELVYSRLFYEKEPTKIIPVFIVFVIILIISFLSLSFVFTKNYVIKANGVVTVIGKVYIPSKIDGVVTKILKKEGDFVTFNEELLYLDNGEEIVEENAVKTQIDFYQSQLDAMDNFVTSLETRVNNLNNNGLEQEYYGKVEYYLSQIKATNKTNNESRKTISEKEEKVRENENKLKELQSKVVDNASDSKEDPEDQQTVSKEDIEIITSELEELNNEINQMNIQIENSSDDTYQLKAQFISEVGASRSQILARIEELKSQDSILSDKTLMNSILSMEEGTIHYLSDLKLGIPVQKNQIVAEIVPKDGRKIVEAYIEAKDISKVKINQEVNVSIIGVNSHKFGFLNGKIIQIDSGTTVEETQEGNLLFYKIQVELFANELTSSSGEIVEAINSMPVEVSIIYKNETYFDWFINLFKSN